MSMSAPTVSAVAFKLGTGLFLMLAGLAGAALLFIPWRKAMETRAWAETPCVIIESRIDQQQVSDFAGPVHRVFLKYRYTRGGEEFTGTRWRLGSFFSSEDKDVAKKTPHFAEAEKLVARFPAGASTVCWVNPASPSEAVLEHHTKAAIYTIWWPLLFAAGGGGMVWSVLRRRSRNSG
jgi:hypothetical protein